MTYISSSGEIVPDKLPNAPLPSPPQVAHRRRIRGQSGSGGGASSSSSFSGAGASAGGGHHRHGDAGSLGGIHFINRDSALFGLPDVDIFGTRVQGLHILLVIGSFLLIGWRAIFVALLLYILAVQPNGHEAAVKAHSSGPNTPRAGTPARESSGAGGSGGRTFSGGGSGQSSTKGLFKGTGHKLGCA
uniref:Uncharacterized protein n=1 Tax=Chloropicon laureae TaxID=464258 RepID=A0A7S2Z375_9CHLO|mmetsp:Transcript_3648/g.9188  ORF Transcript_3648/g.9188 Transcript_3648/m.9188 type:complete len:188 (+) Transcript_3648:271-834(+)